MPTKLNILESKKLFKEFSYLMSDFEFKTEFAMEYSIKFEMGVRKFLKEEPIIKQVCIDKFGDFLKSEPKSDTKNRTQMSDSKEIIIFSGDVVQKKAIVIIEGDSKKVKQLYRKIVQKTHPDKVNSDTLRDLYNKATKANKNKDILTLYYICNELNIKFNITDDEISILRTQNQKIKMQQMYFENSHLWVWVNSKNENQKKEVIKNFLLHNAPAVKDLFAT